MGDGDELSREHHVRRRAEQVLAEMRELWGDEMPPGPDPVTTALVDALATDDDRGRRQGLLVQGDAVPFSLLTRLMTTSPVGQEVLHELPPGLRARIDLVVATSQPDIAGPESSTARAVAQWSAGRGMPQIPSGAFAMHASPPVVDLDERVSSLMGWPARQHRLPSEALFDAVHPEDQQALGEAVRRAFERRGSLVVRYRVVHPDGAEYWLSSVGHALTGEDGSTDQVVGFTVPSP